MTQLSTSFRINTSVRQLARFLTVGMLGTCVDLALFAALYSLFGFSLITANVIAYSVGIVHNYFLHRYWTYSHTTHKSAPLQAAQFVGVSLCAMVVNTALVVLLAPPLGVLFAASKYGDLLAKLCATGIGVCINFLANHLWTFRDTSAKGEQR